MKQMTPFTPHLANECLELMKCKDVNTWPKIEKNSSGKVKIAIQINGKTRDIISVKENINQQEINDLILKNSKAKKYIQGKKITKVIFVKNKIINYIILNT
jgi:leucyl-tRNA synthetase